MKMRDKIIGISMLPIVLLAAAVVTFSWNGQSKVADVLHYETETQVEREIKSTLSGIMHTLKAQNEVVQQKVNSDLEVAKDVLKRTGEVSLNEADPVQWSAINQFTKNTESINLPKMEVGGQWLGQNANSAVTSLIVDDIKKMSGSTCTIFQRMNKTGDMLRVSTNVLKLDGKRAIGTYIPRHMPDGSENKVLRSIYNGQTFRGRAYVVNAWYQTAYYPLKDADGEVTGILYVGVKMDHTGSVAKAIQETPVGKSGYVFVLGGKGSERGKYVISKDRKADGKDIWDVKDGDGNFFIRDMTDQAIQANGEVEIFRYTWKNAGETEARKKIASVVYFEPWDWVLGAGAYEDDFLDGQINVSKALSDSMFATVAVALLILLSTIIIGMLVIRSITRSLDNTVNVLSSSSEQLSSASSQIASSSQSLAESSSEQAASLEEISASLAEVATSTQGNASDSTAALQKMQFTSDSIEEGGLAVKDMSQSMSEIDASSKQISEIIQTIEGIAFQTNLLALNAAVEAARAGDAGKGFAVVAEEVRNLAQRVSEAANDTSNLINTTVNKIQTGSNHASGLQQTFERIDEAAGEVADLMGKIANASSEQSKGVAMITDRVTGMEAITQGNASNSEESAAASEELNAQVEQMNSVVISLKALVNGNTANTQGQAYAPMQHSFHAHPAHNVHPPMVPAPQVPKKTLASNKKSGASYVEVTSSNAFEHEELAQKSKELTKHQESELSSF